MPRKPSRGDDAEALGIKRLLISEELLRRRQGPENYRHQLSDDATRPLLNFAWSAARIFGVEGVSSMMA